jgi:tetratricopeptide (TPR) repeat protein
MAENGSIRAGERLGYDGYERLLKLLDERRFDEALTHGRVLLESPEIGLLTRAKTHNLLCWTLTEGLKRPSPEAALHAEEAIRIGESLSERSLTIGALLNLAAAAYNLADWAGAQRAYERVGRLLGDQPSLLPCGRILAAFGLAQLDLVGARYEAALARLEAAITLCAEEQAPYLLAELHRRRAVALIRFEQPEAALAALAQIDEAVIADGPRALWWKTHLGFTRGQVEIALGHWKTARPLVTNTLALARELGDGPVIAECLGQLAILDAQEGKREAKKRAHLAMTAAITSGRRELVEDLRNRLSKVMDLA